VPSRDYIERLAQERFQGRLRNEFIAAIDRITEDMEFDRIVALIEAGDVEGAVQAVGLEPERFRELSDASDAAFAAAGNETAKIVRGKFVFQPGNPRAERAVDELHTELMRGLNGGPAITEEGKRAVREHIRRGLEEGKNPRTIARRMRGTYDYSAKAYRGGMIGVTDTQAKYISNAERQLRSGDPTELRRYLGRRLRDKRYDRTVLKAIRGETKLTETQIQNMVHGYSRKYTKYRAETVARDQSLSALTKGQEEALDQAVSGGHVKNHEIRQAWLTAKDERVRNAHRRIPSMNPGGVKRGEAFDTPLGPMRFPRDPQGTAANRINCRCSLTVRIKREQEVPV